jgi:hypothetical protein
MSFFEELKRRNVVSVVPPGAIRNALGRRIESLGAAELGSLFW